MRGEGSALHLQVSKPCLPSCSCAARTKSANEQLCFVYQALHGGSLWPLFQQYVLSSGSTGLPAVWAPPHLTCGQLHMSGSMLCK